MAISDKMQIYKKERKMRNDIFNGKDIKNSTLFSKKGKAQ
jgi:hypothetical protein